MQLFRRLDSWIEATGRALENSFRSPLAFSVLALLTVALKVWLASLGHNYDIESWEIVGKAVHQGRNVYLETFRYPYGPLWYWFLGASEYLSIHLPLSAGRENFHLWVTLFLCAVDIGVALVLRRLGLLLPAIFFLLNPLTWLISGFHAQFDQFPILIGLGAVLLLQRRQDFPAVVGASVILGISLIMKHTLIIFPFWLALWLFFRDRKKTAHAAFLLFVPPLIFLAGFAPWFNQPEVLAAIKAHVISYRSDYLYALVPKTLSFLRITPWIEWGLAWVPLFAGYNFIWLLATLWNGYLFRRRSPFELLLLYTLVLMIFTPALADQYYVVPALACAYFWRSPWSHAYVWSATLFLVFFSPANVVTIPAMTEVRAALDGIPYRRYLAVIFLFLLWLQLWSVAKTGKIRPDRAPAT